MPRPSVILYLLCLMLMFMGCQLDDDIPDRIPATPKDRTTLTVFAAASLSNVFQDIEKAFEKKHPQVDIILNLAGSQQLASQIQLGAPADVFASADTVKMNQVANAGFIQKASIRTFAANQLVVIIPHNNPAKLKDFSDLASVNLKLVLAAPEVPAGRYTRSMLELTTQFPEYLAGFQDSVLDRVVSLEQNVRAVRTKVALGEADAGIVYESDVYDSEVYISDVAVKNEGSVVTQHEENRLATLPIPSNINPTATYPIAPLHSSAHQKLACTFIDFVLSEEGQQLLANHGFVTP